MYDDVRYDDVTYVYALTAASKELESDKGELGADDMCQHLVHVH